MTAVVLALMVKDDYGHLVPTKALSPKSDALSEELIKPNQSTLITNNEVGMLFGRHMAEESAPKQKDIPETRLDLVLKGTFTHTENKKASALIAKANQDTERFFIGDLVPGDAELVAVNLGEVILRRNGQDESLKLPMLKEDERVTRELSRQRATPMAQASSTTPAENSKATNSAQHQKLKERLARLRDNRSKTTH
ncbi:MAG: type II secretion system protein N [Porticoccus sp.]|nr:type II secretion system protein N [Porticoccus sp.]